MGTELAKTETIESSPTLDLELSQLIHYSDHGHIELLTQELFPLTSAKFPDLFVTYYKLACANRSGSLFRIWRNSTTEEERENALKQMAQLNAKASEKKFSENDGVEAVSVPFWMNDQEREGLRYAVWLGDDEVINPANFPSLLGVREAIIKELKVDTLQHRINRLGEQLNARKKTLSLLNLGVTEDQICGEIRQTINALFQKQTGFLAIHKPDIA
jgi:uncharacterized coiled-coil protein SlyX